MPVRKGKRTDLDKACEIIAGGGSLADVAEESLATAARYSRNLNDLKFILMAKQAKEPREIEVIVINGPTGVGKSHLAMEMASSDPKGYYMLCSTSSKSTLWFDGYSGENTLVMDEFRPTWCNYSYLLRLLDKWPLRLPMKGAHTWALWTRVIITTTHPVGTWYDVADSATGELFRRISRTITLSQRAGEERESDVVPGSTVVGNNGTTTVDPPRAPPESGFTYRSFVDQQAEQFGWHQDAVPEEDTVIEEQLSDLNDQLDYLFP
jgi:hypothetical protein